VTKEQIESKCIALDFNAEKFEEWVASLQPDAKFEGIQVYCWNETKTKEEKRLDRSKKLADAKRKI